MFRVILVTGFFKNDPQKEPLLEPLLRKMRVARIMPVLRAYPNCRLLDVGCGFKAQFLWGVEQYIGSGVGIDFKAPELRTGKITTIRATLVDSLPFPDKSFDVVTMLAVLEHLENYTPILCEC